MVHTHFGGASFCFCCCLKTNSQSLIYKSFMISLGNKHWRKWPKISFIRSPAQDSIILPKTFVYIHTHISVSPEWDTNLSSLSHATTKTDRFHCDDLPEWESKRQQDWFWGSDADHHARWQFIILAIILCTRCLNVAKLKFQGRFRANGLA